MSTKEIESKVTELKELKALQEELQAEITALEDTIKAEMIKTGSDTLQAGIFKVLYKTVITNRFDTKAFRATHGALYEQYTKQTESRRFSIV